MIDLFLNTITVVAGALIGVFAGAVVIFLVFVALLGCAYIIWSIFEWIEERMRR